MRASVAPPQDSQRARASVRAAAGVRREALAPEGAPARGATGGGPGRLACRLILCMAAHST